MSKPLVVLFCSLTLLGCAASDPWRNPSGEYSRSVVLDGHGVGRVWSTGYIENRVYYPKGLPTGLLSHDSYLIGYKNSRLTMNERENIAIYRGLELGQSLGYSCMVITSERTLSNTKKIGGGPTNSVQGTISISPSIDGRSAYGSIDLFGNGGVYEYNADRLIMPVCTKAASAIPKNECTYSPMIDFGTTYYAIYPEECRTGKGADRVKGLIDGHPDKDKFNVLDVNKKIISYEALKRNILNER